MPVQTGVSSPQSTSPINSTRVLLAGTGLTHLGSARERQAMHLGRPGQTSPMPSVVQEQPVVTDSMRMFQWGVDDRAAQPKVRIGIAPEWFFKGDASVCFVPPLTRIEIPSHAEDGGEEAELAGSLPYRRPRRHATTALASRRRTSSRTMPLKSAITSILLAPSSAPAP